MPPRVSRPPDGLAPDEIELDAWGYVVTGSDLIRNGTVVERWPLRRPPFDDGDQRRPGIFAVGDVRHGSTKRVAAGAGEGAVVVAELHRLLASQAP